MSVKWSWTTTTDPNAAWDYRAYDRDQADELPPLPDTET